MKYSFRSPLRVHGYVVRQNRIEKPNTRLSPIKSQTQCMKILDGKEGQSIQALIKPGLVTDEVALHIRRKRDWRLLRSTPL